MTMEPTVVVGMDTASGVVVVRADGVAMGITAILVAQGVGRGGDGVGELSQPVDSWRMGRTGGRYISDVSPDISLLISHF
jgi:hypothetical protein